MIIIKYNVQQKRIITYHGTDIDNITVHHTRAIFAKIEKQFLPSITSFDIMRVVVSLSGNYNSLNNRFLVFHWQLMQKILHFSVHLQQLSRLFNKCSVSTTSLALISSSTPRNDSTLTLPFGCLLAASSQISSNCWSVIWPPTLKNISLIYNRFILGLLSCHSRRIFRHHECCIDCLHNTYLIFFVFRTGRLGNIKLICIKVQFLDLINLLQQNFFCGKGPICCLVTQ